MGPHIDAFCGEICLKLVDIDEELRHLKITIREKARHAEPEVRSQLEKVMKRIACNQPKVAAARAQVEHWITDKAKDALRFRNEEIPEDRKLRRAAEADRYAAACIDLAIAAVDEAEPQRSKLGSCERTQIQADTKLKNPRPWLEGTHP